MNIPPEQMDILYPLYKQHIIQLNEDVATANTAMGCKEPRNTNLQVLPRPLFEELIRSNEDPAILKLWLRRIVDNHYGQLDSRLVTEIFSDQPN